jgi:hypothetical protein
MRRHYGDGTKAVRKMDERIVLPRMHPTVPELVEFLLG